MRTANGDKARAFILIAVIMIVALAAALVQIRRGRLRRPPDTYIYSDKREGTR